MKKIQSVVIYLLSNLTIVTLYFITFKDDCLLPVQSTTPSEMATALSNVKSFLLKVSSGSLLPYFYCFWTPKTLLFIIAYQIFRNRIKSHLGSTTVSIRMGAWPKTIDKRQYVLEWAIVQVKKFMTDFSKKKFLFLLTRSRRIKFFLIFEDRKLFYL